MNQNRVATLIKQEFYKFGFTSKELRKYEKFIVDEKHHHFFFNLFQKALKKTDGRYSRDKLIKTYLNNELLDTFIINKYHENHVSDVLKKMGLLR